MKWFKSKSRTESNKSDEYIIMRVGYEAARQLIMSALTEMIETAANHKRETQQPPMKPGDKVIVNRYKLYANDEDATICESWYGSPSVVSSVAGNHRSDGIVLRGVITGVDVNADFAIHKASQFISRLSHNELALYAGNIGAAKADFAEQMYEKTRLRDWDGLYWSVKYEIPELELKHEVAHSIFLREKSAAGRETARIWAMEIKHKNMMMEAEALSSSIYNSKTNLRVAFIESLKQ
jgi:hypothetical protein